MITFQNLENELIILNKTTIITIRSDTSMVLDGNIKDAAKVFFDVIMNKHKNVLNIIICDCIFCDLSNFSIKYTGNKKPDFFDELNKEINRIHKLRMFW